MSNVSTEYALHHIGTIQAVHAVGSHYAHLTINHLAGAIVDLLAAVHTELQVGHEIVEGVELVLNLIHELRKVFPFHLATLVVEVEPHILYETVFNSVHDLSESSTDTQLRALFVNQVDKHLFTI